MSDLLHIVKGLSVQPKCVLVLGTRTEAMLNWLFSLTASNVVLVEPEPAMFKKAKAMHNAKGKPENVTVTHGVPVFESEQKTVSYLASNVPGFSSTLPPNVIKSIRPALEFTEQETPVIELKPLLQQFDISEGRPCLLISQLNGAEQQCLNKQIVNAFTHVVIQSALKPIFGESKPAEKLKKELAECGRDYLELAESMPPYSNFVATKKVNAQQALNYFNQRQQHREIKVELENQLSSSQNEAKKVNEELQLAKQQLQSAQQQLQSAQQQLQSAQQQAEEKQKELAEEMSKLHSELDALKNKNEELSESRDQQKHWHLENKKWAEGLVEKNRSLETKLSDCEKQVSALESNVTTLKESYNASSIKEKDAVKTLALNTKLMSKLQSDLDELRFQYKEKVETEKALQELIAELHIKLKQASVFYHNLESQFPEIASAIEERD